MKKLLHILILTLFFPAYSFAQTDFVFTDASILPIYGKVSNNTAELYSRLPLELKGQIRNGAWTNGLCSSGLLIRFTSDAGEFRFKWRSTKFSRLSNMCPTGVRGMALYVLDGNEWNYIASLRPDNEKPESESSFEASRLQGQVREYMIYLSLYDSIDYLQIGIPQGRSLMASTLNSPRTEKPVIVYGTSILQGASATHPGMCGTAQLSRKLDRIVINLGFSGNCYLEAPIAEYMASYPDPGAYMIDNWNSNAEVGEKGLEKCLRILLAAHPETPILVVDRPLAPKCAYDDNAYDEFISKQKVAAEVVCKLRKEGYKKVWHITPTVLGSGNSGTADGTHFTDEAFSKWVDAVIPKLKKVYK